MHSHISPSLSAKDDFNSNFNLFTGGEESETEARSAIKLTDDSSNESGAVEEVEADSLLESNAGVGFVVSEFDFGAGGTKRVAILSIDASSSSGCCEDGVLLLLAGGVESPDISRDEPRPGQISYVSAKNLSILLIDASSSSGCCVDGVLLFLAGGIVFILLLAVGCRRLWKSAEKRRERGNGEQ
jgi:hypothetical protein